MTFERVAAVVHVEPRQRAPGAADRVKYPAGKAARDGRCFQRGARHLARGLQRAARRGLQAQTAEQETVAEPICLPKTSISSRLPPPRSPATPSASSKPATTPRAAIRASSAPDKNGDRHAAYRLDLGDERCPVCRLAGRGRGQHVKLGDALLAGERGEAPDGGKGLVDRVGCKAAAFRDPRTQAREHLFVEQRRRRSRQPLINDKPDGVRTDVDDGDRAAAGYPAGRGSVIGERLSREGRAKLHEGAMISAIDRDLTGSGWS
jgi:hypothetical protein